MAQFDHPKFIKKIRKSLALASGKSCHSEVYSGEEALFRHLAQAMHYCLTFSFDAMAAL
jgi:hypothetical protein